METQYTRISMTPSGVPPVFYMSQYDVGRPIGFICDADLSNYTVTLEATRTDGTPVLVGVTVDGNIGAFTTTATMTNKEDDYPAQIVISADGERIASIHIRMHVVKAAMNENSETIEEDESLFQQYTEAVQTLIDEIKEEIKKKNIGIIYPPMALTANATGSCQAMHDADGHAVLVDMGIYASYDLIKAALKSAGITTIDHVIISHWHGDHTGINYTGDFTTGYDHWKNDFDMSNTVFWIPVMPSTYGTDEDQYLVQSFAGHTINRVTTNGEVFTWNGVTYSIYNASAEDFAYYDEHSPSDYNAYSFIVYATCGNSRICNTADINDVACAHAVEQGYALQSSLMTAPHHGVNNSNSGAFANTVRPEFVYVSNNSASAQIAYRDGIFKSVFAYAKIFTNAENYPGYVSFGINSNGIYVSGSPTVVTPYGDEFIKTIFVDPAATVSDIQDGTAEHPYAYIRRAISGAQGITKIVLLGDTSETLVISGANGAIIIDGNGHSCDAVTCINGAVVELNNLNFTAGYWNNSRIVANSCSIQQKIQGVNSFIRLNSISTNADITVLDARGCVVSVIEVLTPNRTAANSLFVFSYSYATGIFMLGQIGGNLNIKSYYSYVNFNRLSDSGSVLPNIWDASAPPLILYDNTVSKYARLTTNGLKYVQNESDAVKCKQVQFSLPSSITVPANTTTALLTDFDVSTVISGLSEACGFTFDWANGSAAVAVDRLVSGKKVTLKVLSPVQLTISNIRLTVWYK